MNPDINNLATDKLTTTSTIKPRTSDVLGHPVNQVTTFSKYLAMAIFIALPFVGGYVGYQLAGEQVVEVPVPITVASLPVVATPVVNTPVEQSEYTDVELPRLEWKSANEYTVEERSQYKKINSGERLANFYVRKGNTVSLERSTTTGKEGEIMTNQTYYQLLAGADADSFEVNVLFPSYARDKKQVYILGQVLPNADPKTFVPICGFNPGTNGTCAFSKDARHAYWYTNLISGVDKASFSYLYGGKDYPSFALDTNAVYEGIGNMYMATTTDIVIVKTLVNGLPIHFATTTKNTINENSIWAPYLTDKTYSDRTYNYVERVSFSDSVSAYSLYEKSKKNADWKDVELKLSKVAKLGDKPSEVK